MNRQRTNVSSALNGKERYLTDSFVRDFCQTFGTINPDWLLNGDGSMLLAGDTTQSGDGDSVVASEDVPAKATHAANHTTTWTSQVASTSC